MGYNVSFNLDMQGRNQPSIEDVAGYLATLVDKFDPDTDMDRGLHNEHMLRWVNYLDHGQQIRWYGYKDDMLHISLRWPDTMFILTCIGEEVGDYRRAYFQNGASYEDKGELVFPAFQPDALVEAEAVQAGASRRGRRRSR